MNKAVFIDRDGVITSDVGHYYIYKPEDVLINPGVLKGLKALHEAGFLLVIITNQGGIAKHEYEKADVEKVHAVLLEAFDLAGIEIADIYVCPHHDKVEKCLCRKPNNLNIEKAIARFNIDRNKSWMIGDSLRDVEAGQKSGLKTLKTEKNQNLFPYCEQILNA